MAPRDPPSPGAAGPIVPDLQDLRMAGNITPVPESMTNSSILGNSLRSRSQTQSAFHSLMEQGKVSKLVTGAKLNCCTEGRVELTLNNLNPELMAPTSQNSPDPGNTLTDPADAAPQDSMRATPNHSALEHSTSYTRSAVDPTFSENIVNKVQQPAFQLSNTRSVSTSSPVFFEPNIEVLVVDDDPMTRMLMKRMLTRMGCNVTTAENGKLALSMILGTERRSPSSDSLVSNDHIGRPPTTSEAQYDVIFLDNQMPVMSGLSVVERLRHLGREDLVVGVTGKT
jgi:osomolarity two-component system sensor histidine kinase SLN1